MILHNNPEVFVELVTATAEHYAIPEVYVEKDYWVTKVLRRLSDSPYREQLIFKGGTALSKAYKLISRFSEDVDLAVYLPGSSNNQIKQLVRKFEKVIVADLEYLPYHPGESKGSSFRKTFYHYPRLLSGKFDQASEELLLEINTFTTPEPFSLVSIETLIAEFLKIIGRLELIERFALTGFPVNVLHLERTVAEKLMSLVKASRANEPTQELKARIKHIYDLCVIVRYPDYKNMLAEESMVDMLRTVRQADEDQFKQNSATWLTQPPHEAWLFDKSQEAWKTLEDEYYGSFSDMIYDAELPDREEILSLLEQAHTALAKI